MRELLILFGALIGWILGYVFQLYIPKKRREKGLDLQRELEEAKETNRRLEARLSQYHNLEEQLNTCKTQRQQQTEELENVRAKLTSAEAQIATLQQGIASLEQRIETETPASPAEVSPEIKTQTPPIETFLDIGTTIPTIVERETPQDVEVETVSPEVEIHVPEKVQSETTPAETSQAVIAETLFEDSSPATDVEIPSEDIHPESESKLSRSTPEKPDNLRKIEGIGPKVAQLLNEAGILTFEQLAQTESDRLRTILEEAGGVFKAMDPASWPEQAGLAAKGDWEALKILQDQLDGGRYKS